MKRFWIFDFGFSIGGLKKKKLSWLAFSSLYLALSFPAQAQQPKVPRIGFLVPGSSATFSARIEALRKGLRDLGYVEGKDIVIEYGYAEGKLERLPNLAAELIRLKSDLVVAGSSGQSDSVRREW
jgi:putative ABC transport system substrate-binding protein